MGRLIDSKFHSPQESFKITVKLLRKRLCLLPLLCVCACVCVCMCVCVCVCDHQHAFARDFHFAVMCLCFGECECHTGENVCKIVDQIQICKFSQMHLFIYYAAMKLWQIQARLLVAVCRLCRNFTVFYAAYHKSS